MSAGVNRLRELYPAIEPYRTGRLAVSDGHVLYFEESGIPQGIPVLFIHGGPGGTCSPSHRRFFDPAKYRIVLYDQRGCGKSTPHDSLHANTTWDLVEDIERLRKHLGVTEWVLFGGSWGSTLALAYGQTHPEAVRAFVLRGVFLLRASELDWYYDDGANALYPDAWEEFAAGVRPAPGERYIAAYHKLLTHDDPAQRLAAARVWSRWEKRTSFLLPRPEEVARVEDDAYSLAFARIECHYFVNKGFFASEEQLIKGVSRIRHKPAVIVQGRYDLVCPMRTAWELHSAWPEATFRIVPDAGHSALELSMIHELILATDAID